MAHTEAAAAPAAEQTQTVEPQGDGLDAFFGTEAPVDDAQAGDQATNDAADANDAGGANHDEQGSTQATADTGDADEQANTDNGEAPATTAVIDDELRQWAETRGFTAEDIGAFKAPEQLRAVLAYLDRREMAETAAYDEYMAQQQQAASEGRQAPGEQPAAKPDAAHAATAAFEQYKLEIPNPEDFDEQSLKILTGINEHYGKAMAQEIAARTALANDNEMLKRQVFELAQWRQQEHDRRIHDEAEQFFGSLEEVYRDDYGAGPGKSLSGDSKELKNRRELFKEALTLQRIDAERGRGESNFSAYLKRALSVRHWNKQQELARREVAQEIGRRKAQAVARPTQRQSSPLSPEAKAKQRIRSFLHRTGQTAAAPPDELAQFFGDGK